MAALLITLIGAVAGAILVPQELARRDAQPVPTHSPMHRKPPRGGAMVAAAKQIPFARGVCWEAAGEIDSTDLDPLVRIRANWISQTPFGWQPGLDTPEIRVSYGELGDDARRHHGFWGESDEGIAATTRMAHARGIRVLLKPHLWTRSGWSGSIAMKNEQDWTQWFAQYRAFATAGM